MSFRELLIIEWKKVKRSKIIPLIFIAPLLVVITGIANLSSYFTPEYTNAWAAMFIQSALVYAYYLLPLSMIVVSVMIAGIETKNNGILKMLALPVNRSAIAMAKFCIVVCYLFLEMMIFLVVFIGAGIIATRTMNVEEALPVFYILKWCVGLFLTMLPCVAIIFMITVIFEHPIFSVGMNVVLVIPGVLVANTPLWILYPYCYSGYTVSCSLHEFTTQTGSNSFALIPFIPCAVLIFAVVLVITRNRFGKKEMRK